MFVMVTGSPGSGKSAYAVDYMLTHKKDYRNIYANINGLKMHDNIKPLNFRDLLEIITQCKEIYDNQIAILGDDGSEENVIDAPIVDYLLQVGFIEKNKAYDHYLSRLKKRDNIKGLTKYFLDIFRPIYSVPEYLPSLFIFDEAQNQFPQIGSNGKDAPADLVIAWWVSYHRHLYMDVFLITQYYHKVHKSYRRDIEYFLDAVPSSKSLLGGSSVSFSYDHYLSTPYYPKNKLPKRKKVKKRKELFEAYSSGDKVRTKSAVLPLIIFSALAVVLVIVIFMFVKDRWSASDQPTTPKTYDKTKQPTRSKYTKTKSSNRDPDFSIGDSDSYIGLICSGMHCTNKRFNISLNLDHLKDLLKATDSRYLSSTRFSDNYSTVYLLASPQFKNLFKGAYNEKNKGGFTLIK